ncbi:MAG: caspase family protein [Cyclobacteriaceae bacterium]|nr:caspase family protein [Cyclobacteriaceae bacterium]
MKPYVIVLAILIFSTGHYSSAQTRLVIDPQSHNGLVNGMVFTSNGSQLISVSDDKTIRIWDVKEGALDRTIRTFSGQGPEGAIYAVALSPDDRFLAIGGYFKENEVRLIDLQRDAPVVVLKGHTNVITSLNFTSDGLHLASADVTGSINIWDIGFANNAITGTLSRKLTGHKAQVYDISFSPNGEQLVSASYDGSLRLWDLSGSKESVLMRMHIDKVYACAFTSDGKGIVSGGNKGKVILWDNEGTFKRYLASLLSPVNNISINGTDIVVSANMGYHISLSTSSVVQPMPVTFSSSTASAVSSNKLGALAGGEKGDIIIYDLSDNSPIQVFKNKASSANAIGISSSGILGIGKKGNTFSSGFDLKQLDYLWKLNATDFNTEQHKDGAYSLTPVGMYTLSTGFKGTVEMNPRIDGRLRSYTVIDDNTIAVGGDYSLKVYDRDGEFKSELKGFNGAITSIAAANNRLAALCSDQTINIWNLKSGELLTSLYLAPKDEWICWTPQGFYQASSGGEKYMGWQEDLAIDSVSRFYKSSVFSSKFHQPELVKQTLLLGNFKIAQERVKLDEVPEKEEVVNTAPQVQWVTPETLVTDAKSGRVTIKAIVKSPSEIKLIKILVNGRPAPDTRGVAIPKTVGKHDVMIEQDIFITHPVNEIRIFVSNQEAKVVSEKRVFNLANATEGGRSVDIIDYSSRPDLYIVSIGVSKYSNQAYDLNYADQDAESVAQVFNTLGTNIYKEVKLTELVNENATRGSILEALEQLKNKARSKDMVVIFIASHGINDNGNFYILPYDADLQNVSQTLVSWRNIASTLGDLPSNVLVFIDACKSGQFGVNMLNDSDNTEAVRDAASDENGVVIMAASTGNETAQESSEWAHGAFTKALLEGVKNGKADIKPDGTIYLRELDFYVSERTVELTNDSQHPTTQKPSTIGRFAVIKLN